MKNMVGGILLSACLGLVGCGDDDETTSTTDMGGMMMNDAGGGGADAGGGGSDGCTGFCRALSMECAVELGIPFLQGAFDGCVQSCQIGASAIGASCLSAIEAAGTCAQNAPSCAEIGTACQTELDAANAACETDGT